MSQSRSDMPTYQVCGIDIAAVDTSTATSSIVSAAQRSSRVEVHLCNVYTLSLVQQDRALRDALRRSDLNLPDGAPVAWLGWRKGVRRPVRGPGLVPEVARAGLADGLRHYLYGGAAGVAVGMATALRHEVPGVDIVGAESPPFRAIADEELVALADTIRASKANVVWIGLGTPRQDHLVPRLATLVDAVIVPVGAAFDFLSGEVSEAPRPFRGSGLEWIFRLSREPKRLWRRYLFGGPRFVRIAAQGWWNRRNTRT